ncbi:PEPxxWA-CTERM sorting domain-containing protein [Sphingomonas sp. Tas61C01]|uniref:PEPxxWA-CTERM sorting domain-containing protein n=1 Tax=Sphingomonas sp. Tas61C01 TaxID=3458297 RepID=UPI00403E820A
MTETTVALRFRERRVQLLVAGGLAMVLALGALVARNERALFVDGSRDPKAFGALALSPPPVGSLKRFGWVPRDVLARDFAPVRSATLPLAPRRRTLGGSSMPEEDGFAGPVVPIDALPLTADALGLSGPAPVGSLPGPVYASTGGGYASGVGGGAGGGGGGAAGGGAGGSAPAATAPTPAETPAPATGTEPPTTTTPIPGDVATVPAPTGSEPAPIDVAYQPPIVEGPMLQPPPEDWPTTSPDPFETSEPLPTTETPATSADPVTPVPEPSTWTMLLVGFALVGGAMRWRPGKTLRPISR